MRRNYGIVLVPLAIWKPTVCASSGNPQLANQASATVAAHIIRGQTTMAQVRSIYGNPLSTTFTSSGQQVWTYAFTKTHATGADFIPIYNDFEQSAVGRKKSLVIIFNKAGVVRDYSFNSSRVKQHEGVTQ
jgi:outer membrane protein assembly factor BamE (lipoprotein component of BamABCDE complex)